MTRLRKSFAALGILALAGAVALPVLASAHSSSGTPPAGGMGAGQGMMMQGAPGAMGQNGMAGPGMMQNMKQMHAMMHQMMAKMSGPGAMQGCPGATGGAGDKATGSGAAGGATE